LQNEPEAEDQAENQGLSITENAIMESLEILPFVSIRQIAKITIIHPVTVFRRLTKSFHFALERLCWIPHKFSVDQKQTRVIMSKELLKLFEFMRHHPWKYRVRPDDIWFYLLTVLVITNQFGSVQKMKLHTKRANSQDDADRRVEPTRISLDRCPAKG
jgi:hypothetical protein